MQNDREAHWQSVYSTKSETELSWFQESPAVSLELLRLAGAQARSAIVDIGGGDSRLVDHLLSEGFQDLTVLDLSASALDRTKQRLGGLADRVCWVASDVTKWSPPKTYDIWHDRAAFHFLVDPADQQAYVERLRTALAVGGVAIIGTFAPDGPEKCSGLVVARHDARSLARVLGPGFELIVERRHEHHTPWGATQIFQFSVFRRTN
ncbi:class I SAM-dependent methyltransferase [Rhodoblastus sp.]|uniref:class I SAM-dependent methyltransferase n=1 Tax=Rhodoblastus sp. TaxID=1962975 RepID=UPI00260D364F|nr:class I SAM-dependent methyltransferase [Rhodoblastus sp.]